MKKFILILILISTFSISVHAAWPRLGTGGTSVFPAEGDSVQFFSINSSTFTTKLIYGGTIGDREVFIQNTSTFSVYCGTFPITSVTTGTPRFLLPATPMFFVTDGYYSIWCRSEAAAKGNVVEILGVVRYEKKDD
jgi:hypothetical protein